MIIGKIKQCRICKSTDLVPILNLGLHVLSGRFPKKGEPDPLKAPLELVKCENCGLLQLRHSVIQDELYFYDYGYRSSINYTMKNHLSGIIQRITEIVNLDHNDIVLDIGSNDGTLLKAYSIPGLVRIGIDPTINQFKDYYPGDVIKVSDYFSASIFFKASSNRKVKVITSIAMFYDLESPIAFAEDIRNSLEDNGIWITEQSYMPKMLETNSFDTICHEHLEYYSLKQIDWIVRLSGLRIFDVEFNDINGGSFRIYICHEKARYKTNKKNIDSVFLNEEKLQLDTLKPYQEFSSKVQNIRNEVFELISRKRANGETIYIYGASTKGNTLLQFCSIDNRLIIAAADRNPDKWGRHTPGTNIPIISEEDARKANPDYFLVLPWHFREEFLKREKEYLKKGHFIFPLPDLEIV